MVAASIHLQQRNIRNIRNCFSRLTKPIASEQRDISQTAWDCTWFLEFVSGVIVRDVHREAFIQNFSSSIQRFYNDYNNIKRSYRLLDKLNFTNLVFVWFIFNSLCHCMSYYALLQMSLPLLMIDIAGARLHDSGVHLSMAMLHWLLMVTCPSHLQDVPTDWR